MAKIIERYKKLNYTNPLNEKPWECDILSILHDLIIEYSNNREATPNYLNKVKKRIIPSAELLHEYLDEIFSYNPDLMYLKNKVFIRETLKKTPRAAVIYSEKNEDEYLIIINHNLFVLIYNFFCVFELLPHANIKDCLLPKYFRKVNEGYFDDMSLFNELMWEISHLFNQKEDEISQMQFYHDPLDLCEKYIAAIKFLISHEIAHIHLKHNLKSKSVNILGSALEYNLYKRSQEYEADLYAIDMMLRKFIPNNSLDVDDRFEAVNSLKGILMLFGLYDYIESFHDWYKEQEDHPKALFREINAFNFIFNSDLLKKGNIELANEMKLTFTLDSILNQLGKRVPFKLWDLEVHIAGQYVNKLLLNEYDANELYDKYRSRSEPRSEVYKLFIDNYIPYSKEKYSFVSIIPLNFENITFCNSNVPKEVNELNLLIDFNKITLGDDVAETLSKYYVSSNADPSVYSKLEFKLLIHSKQILEKQNTDLRERQIVVNEIFDKIKNSN